MPAIPPNPFAALAGVLLCLWAAPAAAADAAELYRARAIVTGTGEANRQIGFRLCLDQAVMRVSGNQTLLDRPEMAGLRDKAGDLVASFSYRDRLEGIPVHDEQGTHDRPHDLTCVYEPAKLDAALAELGGRPWLATRPVVVPLLAVRRGENRFVLTADGDDGPFMDQSLAAAAEPLAMTVALPAGSEVQAAGLDDRSLWQADTSVLARMAQSAGGVPLLGRLVWSDADLGWVADWRMTVDDLTYDWRVRGVSFDEAFRVALRGAAQILSGNGQPQ